MSDTLQPLSIRSAQGEYRVDFPESIDAAVAAATALPNVVVVADRAVAQLHQHPLRPLIEARPCLLLEATEATKTPAGVMETWEFLLKSRASRETNVVVIGGGIIQDIAQFAAHNFHRGLAWHFIPTTLLSMADSCIGANAGSISEHIKTNSAFFIPQPACGSAATFCQRCPTQMCVLGTEKS